MDEGTTARRVQRSVGYAAIGAVPGVVLLAATVPVEGEYELELGLAGILLAVVGAALGAMWGWLGRLPASARDVAVVVLLAALFLFGGNPGRIVALGLFLGLAAARYLAARPGRGSPHPG